MFCRVLVPARLFKGLPLFPGFLNDFLSLLKAFYRNPHLVLSLFKGTPILLSMLFQGIPILFEGFLQESLSLLKAFYRNPYPFWKAFLKESLYLLKVFQRKPYHVLRLFKGTPILCWGCLKEIPSFFQCFWKEYGPGRNCRTTIGAMLIGKWYEHWPHERFDNSVRGRSYPFWKACLRNSYLF